MVVMSTGFFSVYPKLKPVKKACISDSSAYIMLLLSNTI